MIKRLLDIVISLFGLIVFSPILAVVLLLIWKQDYHSPFYIAPRVGKSAKLFNMIKLRSMIVNADKSGVDSTSVNDTRITPVGHFIRRYKLDEIAQLWNVLIGDMSLVGPRPNVNSETDLYTSEEKKLLDVKPGITDFASIVFSDEGDILKNEADPDLAYNRLIRPWKSRLGLVYIRHNSVFLDVKIIFYTLVSVLSKAIALDWVVTQLLLIKVDAQLVQVSRRTEALLPHPPPGANSIVGIDNGC